MPKVECLNEDCKNRWVELLEIALHYQESYKKSKGYWSHECTEFRNPRTEGIYSLSSMTLGGKKLEEGQVQIIVYDRVARMVDNWVQGVGKIERRD